MRISVDSGKYEIVFENGHLDVLRYGQQWKDCTGDNLILSLAFEIESLREKVAELEEQLRTQQQEADK